MGWERSGAQQGLGHSEPGLQRGVRVGRAGQRILLPDDQGGRIGKKSTARPARMNVSTNSTSAADVLTTTWPGPATGSGTWRAVSTQPAALLAQGL